MLAEIAYSRSTVATTASGASCSQTLSTVHPSDSSQPEVSASRRALPWSLVRHHSELFLGAEPWLGHPCQKQPSTNRAIRRRVKAMSTLRRARPGTGSATRYLNPAANRALRKATSGAVSRRRSLLIRADTEEERAGGRPTGRCTDTLSSPLTSLPVMSRRAPADPHQAIGAKVAELGSPVDIEAEMDAGVLEQFLGAGQSYTKALPAPQQVLVVDFFAGAGGMSCGFHATRQSGLAFRLLAAIDIDDKALETLRANLPIPTLVEDIRALADRPTRLLDLLPELAPGPERPTLVFIGCPPCQGFSAHRKKDERDDARNSLIMSFATLASHFQPDVIVMENVPEMLRGRFEHYHRAAADRLKTAGYSLTESIVDISHYGVPQRRKRAVVFGSLSGFIGLPPATHDKQGARTVRDAISHLRPVLAGQVDPDDPWHRAPDHIDRILDKIRQIPADGGDRRQLPLKEQLACHVDVDAGRTPGFTDVYGRLHWDRPSVTITAKSSTPSCGRFLHPEQHRNITVREAALLQGFPHNYVFAGNFVHQYRQIGEAVPPLFARHLAFQVLDHLRPVPSRWQVVEKAINEIDDLDNAANAPLVSVDLFCGAGGLSLGMEAAGVPSVLAADLDADAVASFQKNLGPHGLQGDVLDPALVIEIAARVSGRGFVLVGGPPCQGFSQQRRGNDVDARNDLVLRYGQIVAELPEKPRAVVLENVMYLDSPRGRHILEAYVMQLRSLGYSPQRFDLNSADFGLPQTRRRIVVVALREEDTGGLQAPEGYTANRWRTLGEALVTLPLVPSGTPLNHVASKEQAQNVRRMSYVDMGRGRTAIPEEFQLGCHRRYDGHLDVFGRLDWFGYARTITGGFDSSSRGEYTHPFQNRSITAREAARIQGFPDHFEFQGNKAAVRRQIGNAVPPPVGYAIGESLRASLGC